MRVDDQNPTPFGGHDNEVMRRSRVLPAKTCCTCRHTFRTNLGNGRHFRDDLGWADTCGQTHAHEGGCDDTCTSGEMVSHGECFHRGMGLRVDGFGRQSGEDPCWCILPSSPMVFGFRGVKWWRNRGSSLIHAPSSALHPIFTNCRASVTTTGPSNTVSREGKTQKIRGMRSLTGSLAAASSARRRRWMRMASA